MFLDSLIIHELAHVHTSLKNSWKLIEETENAHVSRLFEKGGAITCDCNLRFIAFHHKWNSSGMKIGHKGWC